MLEKTEYHEEIILSSKILNAKTYGDRSQWSAKEESNSIKSIYNNFEKLIVRIKKSLTSEQLLFVSIELVKSIDVFFAQDERTVELSIVMRLFNDDKKSEFFSIKNFIMKELDTSISSVEIINNRTDVDPAEILIITENDKEFLELTNKTIVLPKLAADLTNILRRIDTPDRKVSIVLDKKEIKFKTNKAKKLATLESDENVIEKHNSLIYYVDDSRLEVSILLNKKRIDAGFDIELRDSLISSQLNRNLVKFTIKIIRSTDRGIHCNEKYLVINVEETGQINIF